MFGAGASQQFAQMVTQKTGLHAQGDKFVGHFQGLPGFAQTQMVSDMGSMMWGGGGGGALGGLGLLMGAAGGMGGMANAMSGGAFMMKHDYVIELNANLPGASLRETTSWLQNKSFNQRQAIGNRMASCVPWIDSKYEVCGLDPQFVHYVCSSPELQQAIQRWPFLNLSWHGRYVWLELVDSSTRIHDKFGTAAMQNGDMVLWGMSVAAAAARATFAR